ncbi:MAG: LPS export ABC transporter periplasmic protein LptC [Desulfamplus sp.]|nr:LPS export ABC transporter periplasmic protein LptC [Desulfamplus sp.]
MRLIKIKREKLKIILFLLLFFMAAGLGGLYYFQSLISGKKVIKDINIDSEASLILNTMQHTSTRNGIKEWTLEASSAKVLKNEAKALLVNVSVLFFLKNGKSLNVTAKKGIINTKENNIQLSDSVVARYGETIIRTDQLHYDKKSNIVYSTDHVIINRNTSVLESDTLKIDLTKNTLLLKGHVFGVLSESFDFTQ